MNDLRNYFESNTGNGIHKWIHYFDIYDRHFSNYRNKPIVILEIGVNHGGSLRMWRDYFGKEAQIFAIDINPMCKQWETDDVKIFIGSQEDRSFLQEIKMQIPKIDILIDDGGHTMNQQIVSFEELFPHVNDEGLYLCEDLHTSYWKEYGGDYKNPKTFIEYSKNFIDYLHAWHSRNKALNVNKYTESMYSLHYYDSILVIEKRKMAPPVVEFRGKLMIDQVEEGSLRQSSLLSKIVGKFKQ